MLLDTVAAGPIQKPAGSDVARIDLTYEEAKPVVDTLRDKLPDQISGVPATAAEWPAWLSRRDAEIRARLHRGDEDSLLNFMLFGTTFTRLPRALNDSAALGGPQRAAEIVRGRIADLTTAIMSSGGGERLRFARQVVEGAGIRPASRDGRAAISQYLRQIMTRVVAELRRYAETVESVRASGDPVEEFVVRSKLLQTRGLSSDTSIRPDEAIDEALDAMHAAGLLPGGSIHRVAIIGPGLDFVDKAEGYDFYPPQVIQPFAVIDSLVRLRLARADALDVTTLDLNPRVNEHLEAARQRARAGHGYTLQLARDVRAGWQARLSTYWRRFGDQIGDPARAVEPSAGNGDVDVRAVRVRPRIVMSVVPRDLDIVTQHLAWPVDEPQFDLIIATNIFVYYGAFEQALALVNVTRMLRPGGWLLSNNALPDRLVTAIKPVGSTRATYSSRPDDGDQVIWYQRQRSE
jgi:hypothetical protein